MWLWWLMHHRQMLVHHCFFQFLRSLALSLSALLLLASVPHVLKLLFPLLRVLPLSLGYPAPMLFLFSLSFSSDHGLKHCLWWGLWTVRFGRRSWFLLSSKQPLDETKEFSIWLSGCCGLSKTTWLMQIGIVHSDCRGLISCGGKSHQKEPTVKWKLH